jgi:hypothetical protein
MSKKSTRREFLSKGAKAGGLTAAFGVGLFGTIRVNPDKGVYVANGVKVDIGIAEANAKCGSSYNCGGGGGSCGSSYNCSGGGGQCGSSYNCSGT